MLREVMLRCPGEFAGGLTAFQCLVKMQHYGLPTRLLDVTSNPLVALYFACDPHGDDDEDGEVIVLDYDVNAVKYSDSDTVTVIANLSRRPSDFAVPDAALQPSADEIATFNEHDSIKLLLHDIRSDKPHFSPKIEPADLARVIPVKPLLDNPRILRQEGAFLLFGCDRTKDTVARLDESAIAGRFIISREQKRNLRDQIATLGINRATIYPEIEHVSEQVRDTYRVAQVDLSTVPDAQRTVLERLLVLEQSSTHNLAAATSLEIRVVSRAIVQLQGLGAVERVGSGRERRWRVAKSLELRWGPESPWRPAHGYVPF